MSDGEGIQMMRALVAVERMHRDASRLLRDLDGWFSERGFTRRYADDTAAFCISRDVKSKKAYMADFLYRQWAEINDPSRVQGINVVFLDHGNQLKEPIIIVSDLRYDSQGADGGFDHPWCALFDWSGPTAIGELTKVKEVNGAAGVVSGFVLARPLFSIKRIELATAMLEEVAAAVKAEALQSDGYAR